MYDHDEVPAAPVLLPEEVILPMPPIPADEWDAVLDGFPVPDNGWHVRTEEEAAWAMARLAARSAELARLDAEHQIRLRRLQTAHEERTRRTGRAVEFLQVELLRWAVNHRIEHPKVATLVLPSGKIPTEERKPAIVIEDVDVVVEWAEFYDPDLVKVTKRVAVSDLKKVAKVGQLVAEYVVTLECSHLRNVQAIDPVPAVGDMAFCDEPGCDGLQAIAEIVDEVHVPAVVDAKGKSIPGTRVDPAKITARIKLDS